MEEKKQIVKNSKMSLFRTEEQLCAGLRIMQNGSAIVTNTLDNIKLFGFELDQKLSLSSCKKLIYINF